MNSPNSYLNEVPCNQISPRGSSFQEVFTFFIHCVFVVELLWEINSCFKTVPYPLRVKQYLSVHNIFYSRLMKSPEKIKL